MVTVTRTDPYGNKGHKTFNTLEEANSWLDSEKVKQDLEDGFSFGIDFDNSGGPEKDGG